MGITEGETWAFVTDDARLIASSKDLLAACELARRVLEPDDKAMAGDRAYTQCSHCHARGWFVLKGAFRHWEPESPMVHEEGCVILVLDAAIAKAKGGN